MVSLLFPYCLFPFLPQSFPRFFLLFVFVCACVSLSPLLTLLCFFPCFSTLFFGTRKKLQEQGMKICHVNSYKNECSGGVGVAATPDHSLNVAKDTDGCGCSASNQGTKGPKSMTIADPSSLPSFSFGQSVLGSLGQTKTS